MSDYEDNIEMIIINVHQKKIKFRINIEKKKKKKFFNVFI